MHNPAPDTYYIQVSQLKIGLYIHLDLGWMDHPFTVSNFKISDDTQIEAIKALGLQKLRYDPNRSSASPMNLNNVIAFPRQHNSLSPQHALATQTVLTPLQLKQQALHQAIQESEKKFLSSSLAVKQIQRLTSEHPGQATLQATQLVADMVSSTLTESDLAIHAINGSRTGDQHYQHELNVLVLCMMLAKTVNLSEEEANMLGLAAVLHDIGKRRINDRILLKKEALTLSETHVLQTHVELGLDTLQPLHLPKRTLSLIAQHHELADGSGYPRGLHVDAIDPLAHILIIVNRYDNLCNPLNAIMAKSPYEALGIMFAQQRTQFEPSLLRRFIKCLGIYPPGSVIRLSDERLATVLSTNPQQPLRPFVQTLHEQDQADALILDLREHPTLNITQCIKTEHLSEMLRQRMLKRQRTSYFLDKLYA